MQDLTPKPVLFSNNINMISKMDTASGSTIKGLIIATVTNGSTYIRLSNPQKYQIDYEIVDGNPEIVKKAGEALGIVVTNNTIATHHK